MDMRYFLVVYDRKAGSIIELREFETGERNKALKEPFARELREQSNADIEVVVLGATSRNALMHTHSRYFRTPEELATKARDELADTTSWTSSN